MQFFIAELYVWYFVHFCIILRDAVAGWEAMKYLVAGVKENHRLTVFIEIKKIAASKSTTTSSSTHNHNYNQIYVHSWLKPGVKLFCSDFFWQIFTSFFSRGVWSGLVLHIMAFGWPFYFCLQFCIFTVHGTLFIFSQMLMFQSIARLGWSEIDGNMASLFFLSA